MKFSPLPLIVLTALSIPLPTTAAALAFLFLVGWLSDGHWLQQNGLPALSILLSMLTLPHMTEMHRLYTRKSA